MFLLPELIFCNIVTWDKLKLPTTVHKKSILIILHRCLIHLEIPSDLEIVCPFLFGPSELLIMPWTLWLFETITCSPSLVGGFQHLCAVKTKRRTCDLGRHWLMYFFAALNEGRIWTIAAIALHFLAKKHGSYDWFLQCIESWGE